MIIEGIGGKIEATSEEGKGTTITISLPMNAEGMNGSNCK
jgi:signal transduction histidine kinase